MSHHVPKQEVGCTLTTLIQNHTHNPHSHLPTYMHTHTQEHTQRQRQCIPLNTPLPPTLHPEDWLQLIQLINWWLTRHCCHSGHNSATCRNCLSRSLGAGPPLSQSSFYRGLDYSYLNFFTSQALVKRREGPFVTTTSQVLKAAYMERVCVPISPGKRCRASRIKWAFKMNGLHFLSYWL